MCTERRYQGPKHSLLPCKPWISLASCYLSEGIATIGCHVAKQDEKCRELAMSIHILHSVFTSPKLWLTCITTSPQKKKKLKIMEFYEQFIAKEISPIVGFKKGSQLPLPPLPSFFFNQHLIQNWNPVKNSG